MSKLLQFEIDEAASYFYKNKCTENETYLLDLILKIGKEYNKLVDDYNNLFSEYNKLKDRISSSKKSSIRPKNLL